VVGFDTNIVVRLLMNDDPTQAKKAEEAFLKYAKSEGVFLSILILAEVTWVLIYSYGLDRAEIHGRLADLVRTRGVFVEDIDLVEEALHEYEHGKADLADFLIVGKVHREGAKPLLTFDRKLARTEGVQLL
jgi:predicted nucleic-acid-binding protein